MTNFFKRFAIIQVFLCVISLEGLCQGCPSSSIYFASQSDVDSFKTKYPDCTEVNTLQIQNGSADNIINLKGLSNLRKINNRLSINSTSQLITLEGLDSVSFVGNGGIDIRNNSALKSLKGLNNIKSSTGLVRISSNDNLEVISGLNSLESVDRQLVISSNKKLKEIDGLKSLKTVNQFIHIESNNSLQKVTGFIKLTHVNDELIIKKNELLTSVEGFSELKSIKEYLLVSENNSLETLKGLNNIDSVGALEVSGNLSLVSLIDLSSLKFIEFHLRIGSNPRLKSLKGLERIKTIEGNLNISECDSLQTLEFLDSLKNVRTITLSLNSYLENIDNLNIEDTKSVILIRNSSLKNINGFKSLKTADTELYFDGNTLLENLKGLENITTTGRLKIVFNDNLKSLEGLNSLLSINEFDLRGNKSLKTLKGIENLKSIKELRIYGNNNLTNLGPQTFEKGNFTTIEISSNPNLVNIDRLSNVEYLGLIIRECPKLAFCSIKSVCEDLQMQPFRLDFQDNAHGCSSIEEVMLRCNLLKINRLKVFPNPTNNIVNINKEKLKYNTAKLVDITGKVVKTSVIEGRMIDISELESGIYFLVIETEDKLYREQIIKK